MAPCKAYHDASREIRHNDRKLIFLGTIGIGICSFAFKTATIRNLAALIGRLINILLLAVLPCRSQPTPPQLTSKTPPSSSQHPSAHGQTSPGANLLSPGYASSAQSGSTALQQRATDGGEWTLTPAYSNPSLLSPSSTHHQPGSQSPGQMAESQYEPGQTAHSMSPSQRAAIQDMASGPSSGGHEGNLISFTPTANLPVQALPGDHNWAQMLLQNPDQGPLRAPAPAASALRGQPAPMFPAITSSCAWEPLPSRRSGVPIPSGKAEGKGLQDPALNISRPAPMSAQQLSTGTLQSSAALGDSQAGSLQRLSALAKAPLSISPVGQPTQNGPAAVLPQLQSTSMQPDARSGLLSSTTNTLANQNKPGQGTADAQALGLATNAANRASADGSASATGILSTNSASLSSSGRASQIGDAPSAASPRPASRTSNTGAEIRGPCLGSGSPTGARGAHWTGSLLSAAPWLSRGALANVMWTLPLQRLLRLLSLKWQQPRLQPRPLQQGRRILEEASQAQGRLWMYHLGLVGIW